MVEATPETAKTPAQPPRAAGARSPDVTRVEDVTQQEPSARRALDLGESTVQGEERTLEQAAMALSPVQPASKTQRK